MKRLFTFILLIIILTNYASALDEGKGYLYDQKGRSVPAPSGYNYSKTITGSTLGIGDFSKIGDLFVGGNKIYIADTGNDRIAVMNDDYTPDRIIDKISNKGTQQTLTQPEGVFLAPDGLLYICDTGGGRIIAVDENSNVVREMQKPETELLLKEAKFKPSKVVVNRSGSVYVVAAGVYQGLIQYDASDSFIGFFGSNKVDVTAGVLVSAFWKSLFTREQREAMIRTIPTEYSNVFIDADGFIYTVTATADSKQVQQLNSAGENILKYPGYDSDSFITGLDKSSFGDRDIDYYKGEAIKSRMVDIQVDFEGIISVLDNQRGRVFQYNNEVEQLCVFGGKGGQNGFFSDAAAIEKCRDDYIISDAYKNSISVFSPTEYAGNIRGALKMYREGNYDNLQGAWEKVLCDNSNFTLAYRNIGRARLQSGQYSEALDYLKKGNDRYYYSMALQAKRSAFIRGNIIWLAPLIAACFYLLVCLVKKIRTLIGGGGA